MVFIAMQLTATMGVAFSLPMQRILPLPLRARLWYKDKSCAQSQPRHVVPPPPSNVGSNCIISHHMSLVCTGHQVVTARVLSTSAILGVLGLIFTRIWGSVGTAVAFSGAMVLWNAWRAIAVIRKLEIYPSLPVSTSFTRSASSSR